MNVFYYVYILESLKKADYFYIGFAPYRPEERLEKHNAGEVFSTKPYRPWQIIFYEAYLNQDDALRREKYLKTNQGARMLKLMLKKYRESIKKPDGKA